MFINCKKEPIPEIAFVENDDANVVRMDEFKLGYQNFEEWKQDNGEGSSVKRGVPGS